MGVTLHRGVSVVASVILALVRGWELGLVMLALMPLIAAAGVILAKVTTWGTTRQNDALSKANGLSTQVIQNIRTVQSFQAEDRILTKFSDLLEAPRKVSVQLATFTGMAGGVVFMCVFATCVPPCAIADISRQGCRCRTLGWRWGSDLQVWRRLVNAR